MVGQAEIVVGAKIDDLALGHANGRTLRALQQTLVLIQTALTNVVELLEECLTKVETTHV
jgi:hypothetical protein